MATLLEISSAWAEIDIETTLFTTLQLFNSRSITNRNKRTEPCLTPREIKNEQEVVPRICTRACKPVLHQTPHLGFDASLVNMVQ